MAFVLVSLLILAAGCTPPARVYETLNQAVAQVLEQVRVSEAPDQRLAAFEVSPSVAGGRVTIQGRVMTSKTKQAVNQAISAIKGVTRVDNQLIVLPDPALGSQIHALAKTSVVNLGTQPGSDTGQNLTTQALMGEQLLVLEERSGWYRVQMWDGYLGWVRGDSIVRMTAAELEQYRAGPQVQITAKTVPLLAEPGSDSRMTEVLQGTVLPLLNASGSYLEVRLPSGETGWVAQGVTRRYDSIATVFAQKKGLEAVIATAQQFMGLPYLWGGTTAKGFDCSGFTQYALHMNGYQVMRDADQQFTQGDVVERKDLQRGDLVFFATYKTGASHMGIYLGNGEYLHSSSKLGVGISSLDPKAKNYDAGLDQKYLGARRVIK